MGPTIYVNGRITGEGEAVVSALDHGFLYGEGVYEVVRTYGRKPFLFGRHMARMRHSAAMIDLEVPFTDEHLLGEIEKTAVRFYESQGPKGDGMEMYVRILLTRGVGALSYDVGSCTAPTVVIIIKPQVPPPPEAYEHGVGVILVPILRNHPYSLNPLIKSNNLLNNALAWQLAKRQGGYEAIMRNYRGEIAEGSISNIFVVKDGTVTTPPLDAGLLAGITRAFVLELAPAVGVTVREGVVVDTDLFGADECFLTSSTQEIVPVVKVNETTIGTGRPGPVTRRLHAEFRRRVADHGVERSDLGREGAL
ncbi:MAG TPA: aminotransferase class IV [Vicinamibacterales bacterium]|nr:aminotransferase class IV [Vicinamibacterales bacterium]